MAWIEVGINQPSGKYSDFITAQNDYGSEFGLTNVAETTSESLRTIPSLPDLIKKTTSINYGVICSFT